MLLLNLLFIAIASQTFVAAAPKRKATDERVAAVFVKDSENGQLRFLTSTNSVNQLITQKQDLLEQLRPSNGNNNNITPIYIDLNGGTTSTSPTLSTSNSNSAILAAAASSSAPINAVLPQIVGQAVAGGASSSSTGTGTSSTNRFRRRGNKRRRVNVNSNKRRRRRRPAKKNQRKPQVVVVRPQRG
ncbi:uncharacterized protein LOC129237067 [Anastrepha obliqua]|uniref:uncharacterized protein LOC129237067 n=1 Tax=Anastrepha obliqua TaxID=95512 RepID=UPI0024097CF0|nr:uncharacterized protein LOC129237067 [Anastrepha obliqua]